MTSCWVGGDSGQGAGDIALARCTKFQPVIEKERVKHGNSIRGAIMGEVEGSVGSE